MAELIDNVLSGGEYYANNLEDLFNNHAELREDLPVRKLEAYSRSSPGEVLPPHGRGWRLPRWGEIGSTQIFISSAKGRTAYHCASGGNFFLQVYGRKRWTFVNPRHTPFMYPAVRKDFVFSVSGVDCQMPAEELVKAGFPLYNMVPKYEVVLEPGDVLYSPQWWWHTVDNLGRIYRCSDAVPHSDVRIQPSLLYADHAFSGAVATRTPGHSHRLGRRLNGRPEIFRARRYAY